MLIYPQLRCRSFQATASSADPGQGSIWETRRDHISDKSSLLTLQVGTEDGIKLLMTVACPQQMGACLV